MMVRKRCTTPKLTRSLVIDITNNKKAPGTLPLEDHDCLSGPPHPLDPLPDSHLPPPHLGWEKTHLFGEIFPQNPYHAICASDSEYSDDGLMGGYTYPPPLSL